MNGTEDFNKSSPMQCRTSSKEICWTRTEHRQCKTNVQLLDVKWYSWRFAPVARIKDAFDEVSSTISESSVVALTELELDELKSSQKNLSNRINNLLLKQNYDSHSYQRPNRSFQQRGNCTFNDPREVETSTIEEEIASTTVGATLLQIPQQLQYHFLH